MSELTDIPERDGETGEEQLAYLRSYLKDREAGDYKYTDSLLIDLLVINERVSVWQDITGYSGEIPWDYSTTQSISPESRIRMLTGDTDEQALRYTDYDLKIFLQTIPLRYVVILLNAEYEDTVTYPITDLNNPIYIVRKYLGDTDLTNPTYRDADITQMLFTSRLDPFAFVAEELSRSSGETVSGSVSTGGNSLASLDGISFSEDSVRMDNLEKDISYIRSQSILSVYYRDPVYGFWIDGENLVDIDWERDWYGV